MKKLEKDDRVRINSNNKMWEGVEGVFLYYNEDGSANFIPDEGSTYSDGRPLYARYIGHPCGMHARYFDKIGHDDTLEELRKFKADALARYPELAEPETEDKAVMRIYEQWDGTDYKDMVREGIQWGRNNPEKSS